MAIFLTELAHLNVALPARKSYDRNSCHYCDTKRSLEELIAEFQMLGVVPNELVEQCCNL